MVLPKLPSRGNISPEVYDFFSKVVAYLRSLTPVQSLNTLTSHTAVGVSRQGTARGGRQSPVDLGTWFQITAINADGSTLNGSRIGFGIDPEPIYIDETTVIHIPAEIQFGPTRTVQGGHVIETITPAYAVNSRILCIQGDDDAWYDLNIDARRFEPSYQTVQVCVLVNGQPATRYMDVRGGAIRATA